MLAAIIRRRSSRSERGALCGDDKEARQRQSHVPELRKQPARMAALQWLDHAAVALSALPVMGGLRFNLAVTGNLDLVQQFPYILPY